MKPDVTESMDHVLRRLVPQLEPPAGELPDPELVAALGEGRLTPAEEAAALAAIRRSPAARVELREGFPEAFARHFGGEVPRATAADGGRARARPRRARRRGAALATGVALALAAAMLLYLRPPGAPDGSDLTLLRGVRGGGGAERAALAVVPGEKIDLLMKLGKAGRLDALRGARPWGALFTVEPSGRARLLCTHDDARCKASDQTMAYLFTAPRTPGTTWFFFVAAGAPVERAALEALTADLDGAPATVAAALEARLATAAARHRWHLHAHPPLRVEGP